MNGRKVSRQFRMTLAILVLSVLVVFPVGNSMTMEVSLDSRTNESINPTFSEDAFNDMASKSIAPNMDSNYFTENMGQWKDHIKFLAKTSFGHVALGDNCVYYYLVLGGEGHSIKITFQEGHSTFPVGLQDVGFHSNYFIGNDETKWASNVRSYLEVLYENVWPGIDILYYFKNGDLKYDIMVGEYSFASDISFVVEGAKDVTVLENELVIIASEEVRIKDADLVASYSDGEIVPCAFKEMEGNLYGFQVDKVYGKALTIDPIVFSSSSFLGGSGMDTAKDMELDSNGNIVILSETYSYDFPNTTGAYQNESAGTMDMVITKMDPNASFLIFSTYIGGWHCDFPYALHVDEYDDVYATGETWARDFPTTNGTYGEETPPGNQDVFVLKLNSAGSDLIYATYIGNSSADWGRDIEVYNGYAYVIGYTADYEFPFVDYPVNNAHGTTFFLILNQDATDLIHTAFWGGHQTEIAYSLEIDTNGDAVVGGITNSKDFPITPGVYQEIATDWNNGFLLRYRPSTSTIIFSTYIGGSALDEIRSIYLDSSSDIYFSGMSNNPEGSGDIPFPTTFGAYDRTYNGSKDAFIGKMSGDGTNLIFSTLYGSEGKETVGSIDVDSQGNVYFIGSLDSDVNFTVTPDGFDTTYNHEGDVVFAVLNAFGTDIRYSTYLGGNASDIGRTCILSGTDQILLLGTTGSMDFPSTDGSYQTETDGSQDVFISRFRIGNYIYLYEGWNLISVPLIPSDHDLDMVLSSITGSYDAVQWYDIIESSDHWKHSHIQKPQQLNDLEDLDHRMGFWIHITNPGGVLYEYSGDPLVSPEIIPLRKGWNAVGWPSLSSYNREDGLNNLGFGTEVDAIQWYDPGNNTWHFLGPDDHFVPGRGYWMHSKVDTTWEVPV